MLYLCHNRIDWRLYFNLFCTLSARAAEIGGNALPDTGRPPRTAVSSRYRQIYRRTMSLKGDRRRQMAKGLKYFCFHGPVSAKGPLKTMEVVLRRL
jgi:hypothetical protein